MTGRRDEFIGRRSYMGFTQESLANRLNVGINTVGCWERGVRNPSARQRQPLAELLNVSMAELDRLLHPDCSPEVARHEVAPWLSHYDSLVQGAGRTQQIAKVAVPALLQTRDYATAIERTSPWPVTDEQVRSRVEVRMARQRVLRRTPAPLSLISLIDEAILHNVVGDHQVMRDQLDHLASMADAPNVDLRILPPDGSSICAYGGFELLTGPDAPAPFMVISLDADGPRYEERPQLTSTFVEIFEHLNKRALSSRDSVLQIRDMKECYR